jgi:LAO/AO transport system kinase
MTLVDSVLQGDRLALARLLTQVENNTADGRAALAGLFPRTGSAHLIGVTGAPGTGKSSLVNRLALHFRQQQKRVAIAAIDPSSPFTGGAVLGDRVRMRDLSGDADVFIRSMASRGALGGLALSTAGIVQVFDAAGYEIILIETVGAGQGEIDIVRLAHTTLVVEAPGLGDDIQAIKAGILEIADILVVNKADRPGVENTEKALRSMLELSHPARRVDLHHGQALASGSPPQTDLNAWTPPVLRTIATEGQGIAPLAERIQEHREYLRTSGNWAARESARLSAEVEAILQKTLRDEFRAHVPQRRYNEVMQRVFDKTLSPWDAVGRLMDGSATAPVPAKAARPSRVKAARPARRV